MVLPFCWHLVISSLQEVSQPCCPASIIQFHDKNKHIPDLRAFEQISAFDSCALIVGACEVHFRGTALAVNSRQESKYNNLGFSVSKLLLLLELGNLALHQCLNLEDR